MEVSRRWLVGIFVVALLIFLFPKPCGSSSTAPPFLHKDCTCFGVRLYPFIPPGGGEWSCLGFPLAYNCTVGAWSKESSGVVSSSRIIKIACDSPVRGFPPECINELLSFCEVCEKEVWSNLFKINGSAESYDWPCSQFYESTRIFSCKDLQSFCKISWVKS